MAGLHSVGGILENGNGKAENDLSLQRGIYEEGSWRGQERGRILFAGIHQMDMGRKERERGSKKLLYSMRLCCNPCWKDIQKEGKAHGKMKDGKQNRREPGN